MRVETIGDDEVIDSVKKGALCCAMSEMPFGEGMRGKSVCLLTSEEWGGVSVIVCLWCFRTVAGDMGKVFDRFWMFVLDRIRWS